MADLLDLLTLAEAKGAINMAATNTDHDTELARQVTAVSRRIDATVGPVVHRTITAELHVGGRDRLRVKHAPVVSVSLLRVANGGAITTLSEVAFGASTNGWSLDKPRGLLFRRYGGSVDVWESGDIEVTYVAGRYATTAAVDARFKECASAVLRRLWKRESGTWAQSPDFFTTEDTPTAGFFRVADPVITELLGDELPVLVG